MTEPSATDATLPGMSADTLLAALPSAVMVLRGPDHRLAYANAASRALLGGAAMGAPLPAALLAALPGGRSTLDAARKGQARRLSCNIGCGRWDLSVGPEAAGDGVVLTATDMTEYEADHDERLHLSEEKLRLAVEATRLGTWEWVAGTEEAMWSLRQKEIYGLATEMSASYQVWHDALLPDERDEVIAAVGRAADPSGDGYLSIEHRIRRLDGEIRWIASRGRMLFSDGPDGRKPMRLIGTIEDITERKAAEQALGDSVRMMSLLMQEMNHRVKNSLQLVTSLLVLQARSSPYPEVKATLMDAASRVEAVASVHTRLYRSTDVSNVAMADYLREFCEDLHRSTVGDGEVRLVVEADDVSLPTDRVVPLAMIVNELATNAYKYAFPDRSGELRVRLSRVGADRIDLTIADDGVGLPPDPMPRRNGSLGLTLVHTLCRQLQGELAVERPGRGTIFRIGMPVAA